MIKILFNLKFFGVITFIGLIIQIIGFCLFGLNSINHITPFVFYSLIWLICVFLIRLIYSKYKEQQNNQILLFTSIFIIISIIEFFLRLFGVTANRNEKHLTGYYISPYRTNQRYWIDKRTNDVTLQCPEFTYHRKINNEGFSDRNWNINDSRFKILTLGDSFTEGDGADADSTWQRFLERKLNDTSILIMNAGICGSDPIFEYYILEKRLLKYKPNLVIVTINHSDIYDIAIRGGFERFNNNIVEFKKTPWWEPIYAISYISRLLFRLCFDTNLLNKNKQYDYGLEANIILAETIKKFINLSKQHHFKLLFVFNPGQGELRKKLHLCEALINKLKKSHVPVCDLYQYYNERKIDHKLELFYWPIDGHHNANGYELMSQGIYQSLNHYKLITTNNN